MKTIIAGCRYVTHAILVDIAVSLSEFQVTEVVSGTNGKRDEKGRAISGVDLFGEEWANSHDLPISQYPANWAKYKRAAGPIRNAEMADNADALVAIWDGKSRGTKNMIEEAQVRDLKVYVYRLDGPTMLSLSEAAEAKVRELLDLNDMPTGSGVRLDVKSGGCSGLEYVLDLVEGPEENDRMFTQNGLNIYCGPKPYLYLKGTEVGYESSMLGGGFVFNNPNARRSCGCGTSFSL